MVGASYDDDEKELKPKKQVYFEFDCPVCNANNPWPDGFVVKEEILCHYCGTSFEARVNESGKLKLKEM
jgi:transcription elongation factor Elf1